MTGSGPTIHPILNPGLITLDMLPICSTIPFLSYAFKGFEIGHQTISLDILRPL